MEFEQKLFLDVPLNTNEPNPCSPQNDDRTWRGILIRAPARVKVKRDVLRGRAGVLDAIPVCGFLLLNVPAAPIHERIRLFAVDTKTGLELSGDVVDLDPSPYEPPPARPPPSPEKLAGLAVGMYFNPNLIDFVRLPGMPAVYDVHVELRGFRSNVVTIEVIDEDISPLP